MTNAENDRGDYVYNLGIVGCGPRGAFLNISFILVALAEENRLRSIQERGSRFILNIQTFEKQSWNLRAVGNAFSPRSHGTMNTAPVGPEEIAIPGLEKAPSRYQDIIKRATDLRDSVVRHVEENLEQIMEEYKRVNVVAAANLRRAMRPDGTVDGSIPCITRGTYGKILQEQFDFVISKASDYVPFLKLTFHYDTDVIRCDVTSNPLKPTLTTRRNGCSNDVTHQFDHVVFATGTTFTNPVQGQLLERTFLGEANFDDIQEFFSTMGVLSPDGQIRSDARVLIQGMSLSAIDKAVIGSRFATLSDDTGANPFGIAFTSNIQKFRGVFTNVSRDSTQFVAPKQVFVTHWPNKAYFPLKRTIIRAALLHQSPTCFEGLMTILSAATARALNSLPKVALSKNQDIDVLQRDIISQLTSYPSSRREAATWSELQRQGVLAIFSGGYAPSTSEAGAFSQDQRINSLVEGREGLQFLRSLASFHSRPARVNDPSYAQFIDSHNRAYRSFITSSPDSAAYYFAKLFDQQVTSHLKASYDDIHFHEDTGTVHCGGKIFDCILGSRIISSRDNILLKSLIGQVKEALPGKPSFSKGGLYETRGGQLCSATELGVIGHGILGRDSKGKQALHDIDWTDTNNHASVVQGIPLLAKYLYSKVILQSNGSNNASQDIRNRYNSASVSRSDYDRCVEALSNEYQEFQEMLSYSKFCEQYAGNNAADYAVAYDEIVNAQRREAFIRRVSSTTKDTKGYCSEYERARSTSHKFEPQTREQYLDNFIDFTSIEMQSIWESIYNDIINLSSLE